MKTFSLPPIEHIDDEPKTITALLKLNHVIIPPPAFVHMMAVTKFTTTEIKPSGKRVPNTPTTKGRSYGLINKRGYVLLGNNDFPKLRNDVVSEYLEWLGDYHNAIS